MKKAIGLLIFFLLAATVECGAQIFDIEQLLLDVQKLGQLKQILQDLKDGYQELQSGYSAIRDIAKGSFSLHKAYLDGLLAVSPTVRSYERIAMIADMQVRLVQRYQAAWDQFRQDEQLQPAELSALGQLYGGILAACSEDLQDLVTVVTAGTLRASDAERIQQIDTIYGRMRAKLALVDRVSNETTLLTLQRAREAGDVSVLRQWFGVTP